ncbi:hypothetical protein B0H11DRAFT_2287942, partial [Mycena galericulata]
MVRNDTAAPPRVSGFRSGSSTNRLCTPGRPRAFVDSEADEDDDSTSGMPLARPTLTGIFHRHQHPNRRQRVLVPPVPLRVPLSLRRRTGRRRRRYSCAAPAAATSCAPAGRCFPSRARVRGCVGRAYLRETAASRARTRRLSAFDTQPRSLDTHPHRRHPHRHGRIRLCIDLCLDARLPPHVLRRSGRRRHGQPSAAPAAPAASPSHSRSLQAPCARRARRRAANV